jgi:PBSX family phage terminase large subunit
MNFEPNRLFYKMLLLYKNNKRKGNKIIICNEGGSRSSKTWDAFHLIIYICNVSRDKGLDIYVLRDTLIHCRDFTLKDFVGVMKLCGIFDQSKLTTSPKPYYNLWGNNIYFRGLDDEKNTEGYPSDIIFVNEALETQQAKINGIKMRCRSLMILDWNPKFTDHWCFNLEGQPDVFFTRSTYKDNLKLEESVIAELESYCPWNFEDLHLPESERRPHEENIKNKTANKYRWLVYGCGMRGAMEGLIFQDITWIDKLPDNFDKEFCGLDFGFTSDPSAYVKCRFVKNKDKSKKSDLYVELKLYEPTKDSEVLQNRLILVEPDAKKLTTHADCAAPLMISDLRRNQFNIFPCPKPAGSIIYGIDLLLRFNIHIVHNLNAKKEQENYMWRLIQGIKVNEPVDAYNHMWDALRYAAFMELRQYATS